MVRLRWVHRVGVTGMSIGSRAQLCKRVILVTFLARRRMRLPQTAAARFADLGHVAPQGSDAVVIAERHRVEARRVSALKINSTGIRHIERR